MRRSALKFAGLAALALLVGGCAATGAKYGEVSAGLSTPKAGQGRIYFFRSSSMFGAAVQPDIRLGGQVVGTSKPGGFFFVDRPAGSYTASAATETEKVVTFALAAGETKYIRTSPSMGLVVGRIVLELETPEKALAELPGLSYTGAEKLSAR